MAAVTKENTFVDALQAAMHAKKSVLCAGIDPQFGFMPPTLIKEVLAELGETWEAMAEIYRRYNKAYIDAVEPFVGVAKPQQAFYVGSHHIWQVMEETGAYAGEKGLVRIKDAKCKDGGDTADAYAQANIGEVPWFGGGTVPALIRADAVTLDGYIAEDCVSRFVAEMKKHGTGGFVVDKTSFKPNSVVEQLVTDNGEKVWERLAHFVDKWGAGTEGQNGYRNLGVVMGATYEEDAPKMREILPKVVMLVPGYGPTAQGGGADGAVVPFNEDGFGAVVNASRELFRAWQKGQFAIDPSKWENVTLAEVVACSAQAAEFARDDLNKALQRAGKYPF